MRKVIVLTLIMLALPIGISACEVIEDTLWHKDTLWVPDVYPGQEFDNNVRKTWGKYPDADEPSHWVLVGSKEDSLRCKGAHIFADTITAWIALNPESPPDTTRHLDVGTWRPVATFTDTLYPPAPDTLRYYFVVDTLRNICCKSVGGGDGGITRCDTTFSYITRRLPKVQVWLTPEEKKRLDCWIKFGGHDVGGGLHAFTGMGPHYLPCTRCKVEVER